jgi:hypothetical protein
MNIPSQIRTHSRLTRKVAALCGVGVLLLVVSACGSGNQANATGQAGEQAGQQNGQRNGQFGSDAAMPGANGKVAAVDGSTAQVQSQQNGQVAVSWTSSTKFTKQVSARLADVKVGDCVLVRPVEASSNGSDSTTQPTTVTAATVRITEPVNGSCAPTLRGGPGGAQGSGPQDSGPQLNQGGGSGPPSGSETPGGQTKFRGFGGASGAVTAASATGFTVDAVTPGSDTKTSVAVTVSGTTTYTTTAKAAASDVKVGVCVQANGKADDTGALTATRIAVSPAVDGQCGGFMIRSGSGNAPSTQQKS